MKIRIDFYVHWLWCIIFGLLAISGIALMGARFGWILNYNLAFADYIHRTMAAAFCLLFAISIILEILRILIDVKLTNWMLVGKKEYQSFTIITTLLFILSGLYIWVCMEFSMVGLAFCLIIHEITTFLVVGSVIWHMYDKAHAIKL